MTEDDKPKQFESGTKTFDPRARLVSVLGDQLIRDHVVGIIELVKNSYDADASKVEVRISGTKREDTTQVVVVDDGCGMDRETVLGRWFEPATGHKEQQKRAGARSPLFGRLPLGEKGVGRFAAHRLGKTLQLISRVKDAPSEIVVEINWEDFDKSEKYLREVGMAWNEREPQYFSNAKHGTHLLMRNSRVTWMESDIRKLSGSLKRLMSPFKPPRDFSISLACPDFPKYEDLDPGDLLKRSHAQFYGAIDENGVVDFEYSFALKGYPPRKSSDKLDLRTSIGKDDWGPAERQPRCGPFFVTVHLWHRTLGLLQASGVSRAELDSQAGVSVFRDGLRVLPYGEPDDDWLSLDEERYLRPTEAIGRKTLMGSVEIAQGTNSELRDKTNREGLIENVAFKDFYNLVKATIGVIEKEWSIDKDSIEEKRKRDKRSEARPVLESLSTEADNLASASQEPLELVNRLQAALQENAATPEQTAEVASALTRLIEQIPKIRTAAANSTDALQSAVDDLEHERDLLLGLASMGLAAERFTHEFARLTREAHAIIIRIEKAVKERAPELEIDVGVLRATIDALRNDIKLLGPMFYVRKSTIEKELSIRAAVENARILNAGPLEQNAIKLTVEGNEDFSVLMREGPLTQVFNNLFDNAVYWLSRKSDGTDRKLRVFVDSGSRQVLVADNGPGVFPRYRDRIFRAFFTMKTDGRGLGLYIVREILGEKSAQITLLEPGEHPHMFKNGAAFLISFPS